MKKIRDHDKLYLKSNRYEKTKEANKLLLRILKKGYQKTKVTICLTLDVPMENYFIFLIKNY